MNGELDLFSSGLLIVSGSRISFELFLYSGYCVRCECVLSDVEIET